jgi:ABC-type antimicrobial peptide transport system ATPase subunit
MCDLCSTNPKIIKTERERMEIFAKTLRHFSDDIYSMAQGHIKPHGQAASAMAVTARAIIRELVSEWM